MKDNKIILSIIAVAVIGILGVLVYQATKKSPEEKMADSFAKTMESISSAAGE